MRRSGVSPLVYFSKLAREMLRLAASGHRPSTQDSKLAAACADGARLHQRMAGRAGLAGPFLRRRGLRRERGGAAEAPAPSRPPARPCLPTGIGGSKPVGLRQAARRVSPAQRRRPAPPNADPRCRDCAQARHAHVVCPVPISHHRPLLGQDMVERALTAHSQVPAGCAGSAGRYRPARSRSISSWVG